MSSPISILLYKSNDTPIVLEFVIMHYPLDLDEKKANAKTKMVDIHILSMNGLPNNRTTTATAKTAQLEYGGGISILTAIEYEDEIYLPEDGIYYWFPLSGETTRLKKVVDRTIQIHLQNTTKIKSIYACPLQSIPFMDLTGAFRYEYMTVAYTNKDGEYQPIRMPVTLVEIDDKFTAMIDDATGIAYSIERTFVFRKMTVNKTCKNNIKHSI
jgi:hypothetical protein